MSLPNPEPITRQDTFSATEESCIMHGGIKKSLFDSGILSTILESPEPTLNALKAHKIAAPFFSPEIIQV